MVQKTVRGTQRLATENSHRQGQQVKHLTAMYYTLYLSFSNYEDPSIVVRDFPW